ncbi:HAMP domain-containing histidine kinase [Ciceribacter sp. L1K22]|nr:HAMP domain-containing histidine kinase [Ciceribacter sp. L1K22]
MVGHRKTVAESGVSVLSNIAAAALGACDRIAGHCLSRVHGGQVPARDVRRLSALITVGLPLLVAFPFALSFLVDPSIALPLGFALVLCALLAGAGLVLLLGRGTEHEDAIPAAPYAIGLSVCPGLVLVLDPQGHVLALGGRDHDTYLPCLREPETRAFADQVHVSDRIGVLQALDGLRQGADAAVVELRLERPALGRRQGQFMTVRMDMTAERDESGELTSVVAQILDIGSETTARAEMQRLSVETEEANDAKSRFLAAVSHELRTPLNAILGFSDILAGEYFGKLENDRQREYVQLIRQSGAHLLSVVNAMLDMSKIEAGRYELITEPFEIGGTIRECESMLGLQAREKGVLLTSRFSRNIGEVVADQRAVKQILINLLSNAIKFTEAGGAVMVDADIADNRLVIAVSDTGIGIPAEKLDLIGRPFTQIHDDYARRYDGSGLGLSLVKGLTALHGGGFALVSRPGEGTVVTITLPADGSGSLGTDADADLAAVEFPPRLRDSASAASDLFALSREMARAAMNEDRITDGAQAKIA